MLLTRICRRWREIAVGMSCLWCRLSVSEDGQRAAFCYDSWLKRSQGCPLSLELHCHEKNWTELRSLLHPYIKQISSLFLTFSHDDFPHEIMISDFLALRELTISLHSCCLELAFVQFISQPPSTLRSLHVNGGFFDMEYTSAFNLAWTRLTNVNLEICEPNAFLQLLRLCPDLSSLSICISFVEIEALEPFMHTKLQSLHIFSDDQHDGDPIEYFNLFNALSFPNLRALEARDLHPWPHDEFKTLLTRSKCPLESLTFDFDMITDEQRAEYVTIIPSLKVLVVE
ncbi:hypothetical protein EDB19DRAFT_1758607 [Suillus lakei]|nr:hypothetical protein EDB19DRAFT_1758607 [Suillus lakei]